MTRLRRAGAVSAALLLVAGAAFAVGRFSMFGVSNVDPAPAHASAEAGFARDMQVHHAQAVDMALTIHARTSNESLSLLAYDIATSQQRHIGVMSEWLVDWNLPELGGAPMAWAADAHGGHGPGSTVAEAQAAMGMATTAELDALDAATGGEADCMFIDLMLRHHVGAVEMVDAVLARATDARVLEVAAQMGAAQQNEIDALTSLQTTLVCR